MSSLEINCLIRTRRSIRFYAEERIPNKRLENLLKAAIWAPSAHNRQPWRFAVLQSMDHKQRLASAMGNRLRSDRLADGDLPEVVDKDVNRSYSRITKAPAVVVICLTMADMDKYPDTRRSQAEHTMAVQGTAMAAQNLMLAAHAEGLGTCWICAPLFCPETVSETLGLPVDWNPQGIVTLGFPEQDGKPATRRPLSDVAIWP